MKGFALFQRKSKATARAAVMLLPEQILLASLTGTPRFIRKPILKGNSWQSTLVTVLREEKLTGALIRVVLEHTQYQQFSIERQDVPEDELAGALPWAIKDFTSEPVTQLAVDYYNGLTNPQARPRLQVICSPKRRIQEWVSALESEAELEEITTDELALADLFGEQSKVDVLLYQLPEQELLMLAVYKGQLCFSRTLRGFQVLTQLPAVQWPEMLLDNLMLELQRSFDYLVSQLKLPDVAAIHVAVSMSDPVELLRPLKQNFSVPAKLMANAAVLHGFEFLPLFGVLQEPQPA